MGETSEETGAMGETSDETGAMGETSDETGMVGETKGRQSRGTEATSSAQRAVDRQKARSGDIQTAARHA
jgi:hypothetical protein